MTFTQELIEKNLSVWQQCLDSPFLQQLGAGTLDEACFKGYIVDDSLYLREYAKVFAWGMTKAEDLDAIRTTTLCSPLSTRGRALPGWFISTATAWMTTPSSTCPSARKIWPTPTA